MKSKETILLMQEWYHNCLKSHLKCAKTGEDTNGFKYPTRLIDAGPRNNEQWRLRITSQDPLEPIGAEYVTLSHRWGLSPFFQLNSSTINRFRAGVPDSILPKTFRDAIYIVRQLGVRYL